MKGRVLALAFLLLNAWADGLNIGDDCQTTDGESGKCIRLGDCPDYSDLLTVIPVPPGILNYLKGVKCGTVNKKAIFCCPGTGSTAGGISQSASSNSTPKPVPSPATDEITEDVSKHKNLNLLPLDLCGPFTYNRISRGKKAEMYEMPWMALVAYSNYRGRPFKCAGAVINSRYVLTAAHCVKFIKNMRPVSVRLGEYNLYTPIDCDGDPHIDLKDRDCAPAPQNIKIEEAIAHPDYVRKPSLNHDIALLRLSKPANFTPDSVRPIGLPVGLPEQTKNFDGLKMVMAGWGVTEYRNLSSILLKVSLPVIPHQQCADAYKNLEQISSSTQICAGGGSDHRDSCNGDNGGPLTSIAEVRSTLRIVAHGIASFGPNGCSIVGKPVVYTRVGYYMKWILDNMKP